MMSMDDKNNKMLKHLNKRERDMALHKKRRYNEKTPTMSIDSIDTTRNVKCTKENQEQKSTLLYVIYSEIINYGFFVHNRSPTNTNR